MKYQDIISKYENIDFFEENLARIRKSIDRKYNPKVLVLFSISPIGAIVKNKISDNRFEVEPLGTDKPEKLAESFAVRSNKKIGVFKTDKNKTLFIDVFNETNIKFGDFIQVENNTECEEDCLYSNNIDAIIPLYLEEILSRDLGIDVKDICLTVVNRSVLGENGFIETIKTINPELLVSVSLINECENCKSGKGVAVTIKDGNAVVSPSIVECITTIAKKENIDTQMYIGKNNNLLEKMSICGVNCRFCQISVPVMYRDEKISKIVWKDVEKTINLLLKIIYEL